MIDLTINEEQLQHNIDLARKRGIVIPTYRNMKHPETAPDAIKEKLKTTGLWDIDPVNLFRVTWKNEPVEKGGLFGPVNFIEVPHELSGVKARIICLVGKHFPTGCHKVGASFGCLVPRLVTGQFDATYHSAVWPSTGNYCRGGAFNSKLLACRSVAILPAGMSRERFDWLKGVATEIIATPGCESNVKEIFDEVKHLRATRKDVMIFNQFEEMGNHLWHYSVTADAIAEAFESLGAGLNLAGACFTSGSAGTSGAGDGLKERYPGVKVAVGEALQCPTLLENGFGDHRIEGIGDKHVPWIHDCRNTDMVIDIDDNDSQNLLRLFNEPSGKEYLEKRVGVPHDFIEKLSLCGISGIANILCCIKMAKYYELTEKDVVATVLTDSAVMYGSRVEELRAEEGEYSELRAAEDFSRHLAGIRTDTMEELTYQGRKRIHNLKYYTWVEQQGKTADELRALWYDPDGTWGAVHRQEAAIDELIDDFNARVGLI